MTSTAFTSLSVPAMEDSMEVSSSPAGNQYDADIDIDFGDYGGGVHLTDDEHMLEDGEPPRPATATDDMMDDDEHTLTAPTIEEVMQDGPEHEQQQHELADEELIDYDDDDDTFQDHPQPALDDGTTLPLADGESALDHNVPEVSHVEEEIDDDPNDTHKVDEPSNNFLGNETTTAAEGSVKLSEKSTSQPLARAEVESGHAASSDVAYENEADDGFETQVKRNNDGLDEETEREQLVENSHVSVEDKDSPKLPPEPPGNVNTGFEHITDGPPTPTDTGLHPVTVKFESFEMPLFKSRAQPEGLLKDDNLASVSLANLLDNVRTRMPGKTGEAISEDQELSLMFDQLNLLLSEGSRSASASSLNDVLEVFLQLHHNDGTEEIPALSIVLSRQLRFTSSLNLLKEAASHGQSMSSFTLLNSGHDEYIEDEDQEDGPTHGEHSAREDQPDNQEPTHVHDSVANDDFHSREDEQQIDYQVHAEGSQDDETGEYQEAEYQDEHYENYNENEDYPDPEDFEQYGDDGHDEGFTAPESGHQVHDTEAEHTRVQVNTETIEAGHETVAPSSGTSSATIRNDLVSEINEPLPGHRKGERSTLVEEQEVHADGQLHEAARDSGAENDIVESDAKHDFQNGETDEPEEQANADPLKEETLQGEYTDYQEGDIQYEGAEYISATGENLTEYDEIEDNQADQLDYDENAQNQPGEEDEQFHTAFDLFESDDHGQAMANAGSVGLEQHLGQSGADGEDIGFDDDADFGDSSVPEPTGNATSPLGKRSFEEHADENDFDFGEPELKKSRAD